MTVAAPPVIKLTNYINGRWTDSQASEWRDVINPATGEILAQVPLAEAAEVDQAVDAASAAFPDWRRTPPQDRIQPLFKLRMLLEDHLDDIARIITQENGKTFTEAKAEMRRAIENVEAACGIPMDAARLQSRRRCPRDRPRRRSANLSVSPPPLSLQLSGHDCIRGICLTRSPPATPSSSSPPSAYRSPCAT